MVCANLLKLSPLIVVVLIQVCLLVSGQQSPIVYLRSFANNKVVSAANAGQDQLVANLDVPDSAANAWEKFEWIKNSDGTVSLRTLINGKYVCADLDREAKLIANKNWVQVWERFNVVNNAKDGTISLKAVANGKFVGAQQNLNNNPLTANRDNNNSGWEKFYVVII
ncbi:hypothetical protein niasHT_002596 [Heterodera trifolii]|uniref:DUF7910 domain-containing protein n=1 Tax=Heterodera trifolii TaxID=157864 RepID=A0ABD2M0D5_9BILA